MRVHWVLDVTFREDDSRVCHRTAAQHPRDHTLTIDQASMAQSQSPRRPGRLKRDGPNPIDIRVGARLRLRRHMLGLSQEKVGKAIGLTLQQVQKYERGVNRIGASRLYELSRVLDVPVSFFFDDTDPVRAPAMGGFAEPLVEAVESDPLRKRETLGLLQAYFSIEDATVRRRLLDLIKALALESQGSR